jgi:hypothetical protein
MAKPRLITCRGCDEKQPFDEQTMAFTESTSKSGRNTKRYYHNECLNKHNEKKELERQNKEAVKKENEALDMLVEVAGLIHEAPKPINLAYQFPRDWYHVIQDWRNGSQRYTSKYKKRFKMGIPYDVIAEAYKMSKDSIRWAKMDKHFKDMNSEIRYSLVIVNSKIPDALKKRERDLHMEKVSKVREEHEIENMEHEREVVYKKKKASYDISEFLD